MFSIFTLQGIFNFLIFMQCEAIIAGQFATKVIPLIQAAKNSVDICVFDWRWYFDQPGEACQLFNQAVVQAVRRGVRVRALVNSDSIRQILLGVGVEARRHFSSHLLHLKILIIDDTIVITGSHNYTQSAFGANYELSVILNPVSVNSDFSNFFLTLWQSQQGR